MVINSNDNKPPEPALIGKKSTPAPIAVPKRLNAQVVSCLCHFLGSKYFSFFTAVLSA
ncbi:Uncharacterised protein [Streptococcus pneumoniae]|nr:Uncharacterised protein [Streptococcus pneumoniae]COF98991.1 Uncharacterised protein [Streptococcus pneumoniae]COR49402.1 Uncharacterised protein [Streptococcus pneumoniae]CRG01750.1 Uncharacterised protein [Streptococcus pneumoniae]